MQQQDTLRWLATAVAYLTNAAKALDIIALMQAGLCLCCCLLLLLLLQDAEKQARTCSCLVALCFVRMLHKSQATVGLHTATAQHVRAAQQQVMVCLHEAVKVASTALLACTPFLSRPRCSSGHSQALESHTDSCLL